jgi:uncharacterized repeat protein (TIGR03803 family)
VRSDDFSRGRAPISVRFFAIAMVACAIFGTRGAQAAPTLTTLHSFCAWANCGDGADPSAALLMDSAGNIYGTAPTGGKHYDGVVFKLAPNGGRYKEYVLHNFCAKAGCADGSTPLSDLIEDAAGNLYGTASRRGQYDGGVVFRLAPGDRGWGLTVLHNFNTKGGSDPETGLTYAGQSHGQLWDGSSPLYGTAARGGNYGNGVAYQLTHSGNVWSYARIHDFNTSSVPNALTMDPSGNLFGTTQFGGQYGGGLLFKLAAGSWKETVLHSFCKSAKCADGNQPVGRLAIDSSGDVFGATTYGGTSSTCPYSGGCGVVFEHIAGGNYSVIYNVCSKKGCSDGGFPLAPIIDSAGHLFATTSGDPYGAASYGSIFELTNSGGSWSETTLYNFCSKLGCVDGAHPYASPILNPAGYLFGTTIDGGTKDDRAGTVFRLAR